MEGCTRRNVLKKLGAGAVVSTGAVYGSIDITTAASGLENRSVFVEKGAPVDLPKEATREKTLEKADTAILKSDTKIPRKRVLNFVNQSNSVSFAGRNSEEALHALLYDNSKAAIQSANPVTRNRPSELEDYTFGTEYNYRLGSSSATVTPVGDKLNVAVSRKETSEKRITDGISRALKRHDPNAGGVGTMGEYKETTCADSDGHTCLGEYYDEGTEKPYGEYQISVRLYEAQDDGDSNHDYHPFRVDMVSQPGAMYDTWSTQDYENYKTYRQTDFFSGHNINTVEPKSTTGSTGESYSAEITESGGSLSYTWSYEISEVKTSDLSDTDGSAIGEHLHEVTTNHTNATDTRWVTSPGYMVEVDSGLSQIAYNLEEYWKWQDPNTCWGCGDPSYFTVNGSGDGQWNL